MGLQVWLPLNGNLENQGLMPTTFSGTPAWKSYGKLSNQSLNLQNKITCSTPTLSGVQFFSVFFWARMEANPDSSSNWMDVIGFTDQSLNGATNGQFRFETGYGSDSQGGVHWHDNTANNIIDGANTYNTAAQRNEWHHIGVVVSNNNLKSYYDGTLQRTHTANLNKGHLTGAWWLGESTTRGCIQDVRIYDYPISDKEVEEIYKSLVLHYKLDNNGLGNINLLPVSGSNIISSTESFEFQGWVQNFYTKTWMNENLTPGKQYTLSYTVTCLSIPESPYVYKENRASPILVHQGGGWSQVTTTSDGIKTTNMAVGESRSYKCTFTFATATETYEYYGLCGYTALYRNENNQQQYAKFRIDELKLEEGNSVTRWSPAPQDLGLDTSIVYDCSGYKNNGIITGNISMSPDNIRYEVSTNFSSGSYIRVEKRPTVCLPKDAITVNLWVNTTTWYNPISCTEGGGWNFENNSGIRFPVYISGVGYKVAQSSITTSSLNNAWHMLTGTMDKNNIKIYIDGEEVGTVANGSSNGIGYANNYLFINAEAGGDSITPAGASRVGKTSDVRIYATALTTTQIKELYNTSMSIDNKGNIHARELVEI